MVFTAEEKQIVSGLIENPSIFMESVDIIKSSYFTTRYGRLIYNALRDHYQKYGRLPTKESLETSVTKTIRMTTDQGFDENSIKDTIKAIQECFSVVSDIPEVVRNNIKEWVRQKALRDALAKSFQILEKKPEHLDKISTIVEQASLVSLDDDIGSFVYGDIETRFDSLSSEEERLDFGGLRSLNEMSGGGLPPKTLNVVYAGTNVGKSAFMCHCAAEWMRQGKTVVYITLEMSQHEVSRRIEANIIDHDINDIPFLFKDDVIQKWNKAKKIYKNMKDVVVKQFPTGEATCNQFKAYLEKLKKQRNIVPDVLIIDYLNICASSRMMGSNNFSPYSYYKAVAEEMRALAIHLNIPILTASQLNREGYNTSDPSLANAAESWGVPQTSDLCIALSIGSNPTEIKVKKQKHRYGDMSQDRSTIIEFEPCKMRFYDMFDSEGKRITPNKNNQISEQITTSDEIVDLINARNTSNIITVNKTAPTMESESEYDEDESFS